MKQSLHYGKIMKQVVNRLWDTLPNRERAIIACDCDQQTELSRWFGRVVASETETKYNDGEYYANQPETFGHPDFEATPFWVLQLGQ